VYYPIHRIKMSSKRRKALDRTAKPFGLNRPLVTRHRKWGFRAIADIPAPLEPLMTLARQTGHLI
jgi:hypothetical protein